MPAGYPASRQVATAGLEIDGWLSPLDLHVIPSARVEGARDIRAGRDPTFGNYLPASAPTDHLWPVLRLGILRALGASWQVRANAGRYARIPTFVELYGYNQGFIGNPELRAEHGVNADAGATFHRRGPLGELTAAAGLFAARADDLIEWETYSYQTRAENVSRARVWGAESELRARVGRFVMATQATLTDARDQGPMASRHDRQLAHHPRYRAYLRGEWRQPIRFFGGAITLYADADGTAGNFRTTSLYGALPPRLIAGSGVALDLTSRGLQLSLSAYNLLDSRVEDFPGYPLPGRSFLFALAWSPRPANVAAFRVSPTLATRE
jgi:vitamin B12 transporter